MTNKRVVIDIGHGNNTYPPSKGVPEMAEFEFNNAVGKLSKQMLEYNGFEILLSQPCDSNEVSLRNRVNYINNENKKKKIECVISIHADYSSNKDASGHWVFYWHNSNSSKRLAQIWDKYGRELPNKHRGIVESRKGSWTDFMILRETHPYGILIEHGFMSSKEDLKLLLSDEFRQQCSIAITKTVCEYCGVKYKEMPIIKQQEQWYRVRTSWGDAKSQKGAYSNLDNAIAEAKKYNGYKVYNEQGEQVYPAIKKEEDETKHWAYKHYQNLNKKGLNITETRFDDNITRGEIFKLLDGLTKD